MKSSAHGLVVGRFYPPHAGHELLIRTASQLCDRVSVVVMAASHQTIPLATRVSWLREIFADMRHVHVTGVFDDAAIDFRDTVSWDRQVALMRRGLEMLSAPPVATVFTSEPYGVELARRFHAMPATLDVARSHLPVSAKQVRADVAAHWESLSAPVRRDLALRVVVVGAESTGTSTLASAITNALRERGGAYALTRCVPEFAREYCIRKHAIASAEAQLLGASTPSIDQLVWTTDDFIEIANEQRRIERDHAVHGGPVLVCDTDPLAAGIFCERYLGAAEPEVDALARPFGDLYVVSHHQGVPHGGNDVPDGDNRREWMTARFAERLGQLHLPHVVATGSTEERLAQAMTAIATAERAAWQFAPEIG